jgi:hypothetical protein
MLIGKETGNEAGDKFRGGGIFQNTLKNMYLKKLKDVLILY